VAATECSQAEPAWFAQPPEIQEGPERGLLYHVLGVRLGAEEAQARPQHAAAVPFEEWDERPPVPGEHPPYQGFVFGMLVRVSHTCMS
jgi:hypothetical protein